MTPLTKKIRSACRMCHGVCQVFVHMKGERVVRITGYPESPTSRGYICGKGKASVELLYHPNRILYPLRRAGKRGENKWKRISWEEALDEMAERLTAIKEQSGAEYFGMMQGTGRPYTGFTQRFANAFGTPNFTGVAHICYIPRWLASVISMGQLPVSDVYGFGGEMPKCVVIWGCNITETGASDGMCGGMIEKAIKKTEKLIVIDPRLTKPAKKADLWLQIRPGADCALALSMLNTIITENLIDNDFVKNYTLGFEKLVSHIQEFTPEWASEITHLSAEKIRTTARTYANTKPACILWGNALDMGACNFQTARAILILRAITGNIDRPGGDVLWVPPLGVKQRSIFMNLETGGIQLLPLEMMNKRLDGGRYKLCPIIHPPSFWRSIITGEPYRLRALWIVGSNPLVTMTHSLEIEKALKQQLEFIVVSDFFLTPTAQLADLFLPAATWLEQDDVVNLHKIWCVLARKKVTQCGEVRDDREIIIQLAHRLGLKDAFPWKNYLDYLNWVLEDSGMNFEEFCEKGIITGEMKYYKYKEQGFATNSKKIEIFSPMLEAIGIAPLPVYREPSISPNSSPELFKEYPLILTTGAKVRSFFHSEYRQLPSLRKANPYPLVEIHPQTANALGIKEGDWVWVETQVNRVMLKVKLFDGVEKDVVNAQHAWWFPEDEPPEYGWKKSSINLLFGDTEYDPDTGSESLRSGLCRVYLVVQK